LRSDQCDKTEGKQQNEEPDPDAAPRETVASRLTYRRRAHGFGRARHGNVWPGELIAHNDRAAGETL
jgi:hypothetical protein